VAGKANVIKTVNDLTAKQRKFVDIYVANFGYISKTEAARQAGYTAKDPNTIAAKLTNPNRNPHVVRYLEKKLAQEQGKYANKLRSFKRLENFGDKAADKNQFGHAINAEFRSGQLAGLYVDKKEVTHNTLEGMSREQLEKRLSELEQKIGEGKNIIDVSPEKSIENK
jgi:phage terminase small subunit